MPLHVILGKPGSGKSRHSTGLTVEQLIETRRYIVGNVPWKLARLNEYVQEKYPNENLQVATRVRLLDELELRWFWKFRTPDDKFPDELRKELDEVAELIPDDPRRIAVFKKADAWSRTPTFSDQGAGVAYFLDECHIAFNARDWAQLGRACIHYLSQHRKLGDVVYAITQSAGNLDKQFRSIAEDFTVLRNERTAQYGPFRGRDRFTWKSYYTEPTSNSVPYKDGAFALDEKGLGSCYDTAAGIGVNGSKADKGRRAKGLSIWWVLPVAIVAALSCVAIPFLLGKGASSYISGGEKKPQDKQTSLSLGTFTESTVNARKTAEGVEITPAPLEPNYSDDTPERPIWVTGYVTDGRRVNVQLSDGRVITEKDKELARLERNAVHLSTGERIFIMSRRPLDAQIPVSIENAQANPQQTSNLSEASPGVDQEPSGWIVGADGVSRPPRETLGSAR